MPTIIFLNGPSSSGKTTLAKALQNYFSEPFLHIGIDKLIWLMPEKLNNWEGGDAPAGFSFKKALDPSGQSVYDIQMGPFAKKLVKTLKDVVLLLANQDYNLIIDDIAFGATELDEWKQVLKKYSPLYVGVTVPLEILEQREIDRKDRFIGSARAQYFKVHQNIEYDLEVDTYKDSLECNLQKIVKALTSL